MVFRVINAHDHVPSMVAVEHRDRLPEIAGECTGAGLIVELGCWLGACSAAIGEGLAAGGYAPRDLHCYDRCRQ